ncbi:MAG: hypothetical protein ACRDRE_19970 [Pseudonocardiaceae bacterium]
MQLLGENLSFGGALGEFRLLKRAQALSVLAGDGQSSGTLRSRFSRPFQLGTQCDYLQAGKQAYEVAQVAVIGLIESVDVRTSLSAVDH